MKAAPPPRPPPPPGGDESLQVRLNAVVWAFAVFTTILFACRIYTRTRLTHNLGFDDALMFFSMALLYIQSALVSVATSYGLGRHAYYLSPDQIIGAVKYQNISEPFGIFGVSIPKISITLLLIKIMGPSKPGVVWLWLLSVTLNAISIACTIVLFVQCSPSKALWAKIGKYQCWEPYIVADIAISQGAFSAFTDFALALFPIAILWNLQMKIEKKVAVSVLMGLGIFAGISAIIRTSKLAALGLQSDYTYDTVDLVMWVALETNIIMICACIPTLRPLWRSWLGKKIYSPDRTGYAKRSKLQSFSNKLGLSSNPSSKSIRMKSTQDDEESLKPTRKKPSVREPERWEAV